MDKVLINEIHRVYELMGVDKEMITEAASNPVLLALRSLDSHERTILDALKKHLQIDVDSLSKVKISDLVTLIKQNKLGENVIDALISALSKDLTEITVDSFQKMTERDFKALLASKRINSYIGGLWVKNFALKNQVDTKDKLFRNLLLNVELDDYIKGLFDISSKVTKKEAQIIEDAVKAIENGLAKNPKQKIAFNQKLSEIGLDLETALTKYLNELKLLKDEKSRQRAEITQKILKYLRTAAKKGPKWLIAGLMISVFFLGAGALAGAIEKFCSMPISDSNWSCNYLKKAKGLFTPREDTEVDDSNVGVYKNTLADFKRFLDDQRPKIPSSQAIPHPDYPGSYYVIPNDIETIYVFKNGKFE